MPKSRPFREGALLQVYVAGQLAGDLLREELGMTITGDRFALLSVIGALGPITPSDLSRRLGMAPTTFPRGWRDSRRTGRPQRRPNPVDGRSQLVELTPRVAEELQRSLPDFRRAVERVRARSDDDVDAVLDGLRPTRRGAPRNACRRYEVVVIYFEFA